MYLARRVKTITGRLSYLKYEGWVDFTTDDALDLTGVVLFTEGERRANPPQGAYEWQWYGAYKR